MNLIFRKACESDLTLLILLLYEDTWGQLREKINSESYLKYLKAFHEIDKDPNQYLMVVEKDSQLVATCHLTLMPSLTCCGSKRMLIEAVRVHKEHRGQKIGEAMINQAIEYAKVNEVTIIQLTTNNQRLRAMEFYKKLGFEATHIGFKKNI